MTAYICHQFIPNAAFLVAQVVKLVFVFLN